MYSNQAAFQLQFGDLSGKGEFLYVILPTEFGDFVVIDLYAQAHFLFLLCLLYRHAAILAIVVGSCGLLSLAKALQNTSPFGVGSFTI